jgi:Na+/H+ antiporter NhaD/arsenite permease-like protein
MEVPQALGEVLPLWSAVPFVGILLSIAVFPLLAPHFWHRHYPKVAAGWALVFALPFTWAYGGRALHEIAHIFVIDYVPFLILLFGLFTVSGGLVLRGSLRGTPEVNAGMLLAGTLLASWIGTTGAAMVMIRPLLRANAGRRHKVHTLVFFIFLVANVGGSLTPLGDPPLFLGFLHGVPFFWTLHLAGPMALTAGLLLAVYYAIERRRYRQEGPLPPADGARVPLALAGAHNLLFLAGILGAVLLSGFWKDAGTVHLLGVDAGIQNLARDLLILLMALLSLVTTKKALRRENEFSWGPIREVAYLFAGIFMTIIPALEILHAGERGALAFLIQEVTSPARYFWAAGTLSSFLDNAPTYLTFLATALGRFHPGVPEAQAIHELIATHHVYLVAISAGAVFMGANTYIGNAPNFMVKAIAEEAGVEMPSFFGYILRWTLPVNIPIFLVVTWVFFR